MFQTGSSSSSAEGVNSMTSNIAPWASKQTCVKEAMQQTTETVTQIARMQRSQIKTGRSQLISWSEYWWDGTWTGRMSFHASLLLMWTPRHLAHVTLSRVMPRSLYFAFTGTVFLVEGNGFTHRQVELHHPVIYPFLQLVKVRLEYVGVLHSLDWVVQQAVVSKQSHCWTNSAWEVINIDQKQKMAKDSALWNTRCDRWRVGEWTVQ